MTVKIEMLIVILLMSGILGQTVSWDAVWLEGGQLVRRLWTECTHKVIHRPPHEQRKFEFYSLITGCLKQKSLVALDRAFQEDVIPLYDGIRLVRFTTDDEIVNLKANTTSINPEGRYDSDVEEKSEDWQAQVIDRFLRVLHTHVVRIDLEHEESPLKLEARRRRRQHHMMPIMIFGTVAMAMILIPMGFKFLAVLGGKALLLAKMALLLASIQGLKRVATSGVNYGLYHVPYAGWHDRHSRVEYPNGQPPYAYDNEAFTDQAHQPDVSMAFG